MARPTRRAIAEYWIEWERSHNQLPPWDSGGWDWGEAACMACGYWAESWDVPKDPMQSWNRAKGLDRCHVVPAALGGGDDVSNFVLMCRACHTDAPDTEHPQVLYDWMKQRTLQSLPGLGMAIADAVKVAQAACDAGLDGEQTAAKVRELTAQTSSHLTESGALMSAGTADWIASNMTKEV